MKLQKIIIAITISILLLSGVWEQVRGQTADSKGSGSQTWSPPTKRFKIELPTGLREVDEEPLKDSSHTTYGTNKLYGVTNENFVIKLYDLELVPEARKLNIKDKLSGLEFLVGGEDDFDFLETSLNIDGLPGKEIVYAKSNAKGLMIDAGGRIFVLVLITKNRADLTSPMAKKFFSSFRLLKTIGALGR